VIFTRFKDCQDFFQMITFNKNIKMNLKYLTKEQQDKITHSIIGCAMEVHSVLGNGFQEVIYQRALSIEMNLREIEHQREFEMPLSYKNVDIGSRRVDFLVMNEISVEIKAIINLEDVHLAQAMNYLEAYNLQTGLLINFGAKSLQFKRLFNKSWKSENPENQGSDNL
jgi:GxxExxY protein